MEIWYAIFLSDAYFGEELREIFCVIDNRVTWTFRSRNVLYQDVLVNQILYVTYGGILRAFCQCCPCL